LARDAAMLEICLAHPPLDGDFASDREGVLIRALQFGKAADTKALIEMYS